MSSSRQNQNYAKKPSKSYTATSSEEKEDKLETEQAIIEQTLKILIYTYGFDPIISRRALYAISDKSDVTSAYEWILDQYDKKGSLSQHDQGGPVYPKYDCPHIESSVNDELIHGWTRENTISSMCSHYLEQEEKGLDPPSGGVGVGAGAGSDEYPYLDDLGNLTCPPGENWICLKCSATRCSRYVNGHCLEHWETTKMEAIHKYCGGNGKVKSKCQNVDQEGEEEEKVEVGHCVAVSLADLSVWCYECQSYVLHDKLDPIVRKLQELKFPDSE